MREQAQAVKKHNVMKLVKERQTVRALKLDAKKERAKKQKAKKAKEKQTKVEAIRKRVFPAFHLLGKKRKVTVAAPASAEIVGRAPVPDPVADDDVPAAEVVLPPLPPPLLPPPLADGDAGANDDAHARHDGQPGAPHAEPPRPRARPIGPVVRMYSTPQLLKQLSPPGCTVTIDIPACRWSARYNGEILPTIGFGPHSGMSRAEALDILLAHVWSMHPGARPDTATVEAIPAEAWDGLLDERLEQPRKYVKRTTG